MPLIEFNQISKHYQMGDQQIKAVDNVSLTLDANEYIAFVGASGSGKSTMMNIIGCLDTPTLGDYILNNKKVGELNDSEETKKLVLFFRALIYYREQQHWPMLCNLLFIEECRSNNVKLLRLKR